MEIKKIITIIAILIVVGCIVGGIILNKENIEEETRNCAQEVIDKYGLHEEDPDLTSLAVLVEIIVVRENYEEFEIQYENSNERVQNSFIDLIRCAIEIKEGKQ